MAKTTPFNWRGGQVTRLEALTDAVFGFAITLLAISFAVPSSFEELMRSLSPWSILSFAASFAILILVWVYHYRFFKRFDLDDGYTIFLNSALLFVVLVYVYPMKFMFNLWLDPTSPSRNGFDSWSDLSLIFTLYSAGYVAVFLVFALMYHHAWRQREAMLLTELERIDTRERIAECLVMMLVGSISVAIAQFAPDGWVIAAGPIYFLIGPLQWRLGVRFAREKERAAAALNSAVEPALPPTVMR